MLKIIVSPHQKKNIDRLILQVTTALSIIFYLSKAKCICTYTYIYIHTCTCVYVYI